MTLLNQMTVLATWYNGDPDYSDPIFYKIQHAFEFTFFFVFAAMAVIGMVAGVALIIKGFTEISTRTFVAFEDIGKGGLAIIFCYMFWPLYHDASKTMNHSMAALTAVLFVMIYVVVAKVLNIFRIPYSVILLFGFVLIFH